MKLLVFLKRFLNSEKQTFYYSDPAEGLSKQTSHPDFIEIMNEDFYYDCVNDFSPFGNDDGADTLFSLEDWYKKTKGKQDIINWLFQYIDGMGFKIKSDYVSSITDKTTILQIEKDNPFFIRCMDNSIIAAAYGQYKILGQLDRRLRDLAMKSFVRLKMITGPENVASYEEFQSIYDKMESDLKMIQNIV